MNLELELSILKKVLLGILIGVILSVGGFFVYNSFFNQSEKNIVNEKEKTKVKNKELALDTQLVQTLYSYVQMEKSYLAGVEYISIFDNKNKILVSELSQEMKNYLGYRQLNNKNYIECPQNLLDQSKCSSYDKEFPISQDNDTWTIAFGEDELKRTVELIFGKGSYKAGDFIGCEKYGLCVYDSETKKYYDTVFRGGGTGWNPETELKSAKKLKDKIEIYEYVKNDFDNKLDEYNIKYTFVLSEDDNYYLRSIELIK